MTTYQRCGEAEQDMGSSVLKEFESHQPVVNAGVTVDYVFAYAERDAKGFTKAPALTHGGVRCLASTRVLPLSWFKIVAARHGAASQERMQAKALMDEGGQYFFPGFTVVNPQPEEANEPSPELKATAKKWVRGMKKILGPDGSLTIQVPGSDIRPVAIHGGARASL